MTASELEALPGTLSGWLARCEQAHPKGIDMTLDRVLQVKERLGIAFRAPVIMVAGTNGKGSTCALIESIARQAGWRVGLYSKPHLVHFEERCRIGGEKVAAEQLLPHFEAVERARAQTTLTYFEHTTLAILLLLSQADLDLVILEVGLGGRLDAVNVIDADCAVISSIDIDHTDYLGPTRETIGREKAGIFRPGRPAVVGDLRPPASLLAHAQALGTPLSRAGADFCVTEMSDGRWSWADSQQQRHGLPLPALVGEGQVHNAAAALAALAALPALPALSDEVVAAGLRHVQLPGRFQVLSGTPEVILDVAHNPQSVRSLAASLRSRPCGGQTHAVFGCMHDKDIAGLLAEIAAEVRHWYVSDLPVARAAQADRLREVLATLGGSEASRHAGVVEALRTARSAALPQDRIVVFGSFYAVGAVLHAEGLAPG